MVYLRCWLTIVDDCIGPRVVSLSQVQLSRELEWLHIMLSRIPLKADVKGACWTTNETKLLNFPSLTFRYTVYLQHGAWLLFGSGFKNVFRIDPSSGWLESCEMLEMAYFIPRSEDKVQGCCSYHGNRSTWKDQVPRPKQGKLDVPRHFFILLSRESEQDKGCSHFFPAHPSLQSHLPQLHWPWPAKEKVEKWNKVEAFYEKNSNKDTGEKSMK